MPTYEYICRACGHEFEEFQSIKADRIEVCPKCRKKKVERKIGIGGAVIFKGGGFYETDYRSEGYKSAEEADRKAADAKPDATSDPKAGEKQAPKAEGSGGRGPEGKLEGRAEGKARGEAEGTAGGKAEPKVDPKPEPKPNAAAAAENKRIESRATHQSRIGRGIGNIVGGVAGKAAKKPAAPKKPGRKK